MSSGEGRGEGNNRDSIGGITGADNAKEGEVG